MRTGAPLLAEHAQDVANRHAALAEDPFVPGDDATCLGILGNEDDGPARGQHEEAPVLGRGRAPPPSGGRSGPLAHLNGRYVRHECLTTIANLRGTGDAIKR